MSTVQLSAGSGDGHNAVSVRLPFAHYSFMCARERTLPTSVLTLLQRTRADRLVRIKPMHACKLAIHTQGISLPQGLDLHACQLDPGNNSRVHSQHLCKRACTGCERQQKTCEVHNMLRLCAMPIVMKARAAPPRDARQQPLVMRMHGKCYRIQFSGNRVHWAMACAASC